MTWWQILLAWCVLSITGASVWAAMCYARDLRAEREDRMRKAIALRNRLAAFHLSMAELANHEPILEPWLEELDGIMVEAVRIGVPFDAEAVR